MIRHRATGHIVTEICSSRIKKKTTPPTTFPIQKIMLYEICGSQYLPILISFMKYIKNINSFSWKAKIKRGFVAHKKTTLCSVPLNRDPSLLQLFKGLLIQQNILMVAKQKLNRELKQFQFQLRMSGDRQGKSLKTGFSQGGL